MIFVWATLVGISALVAIFLSGKYNSENPMRFKGESFTPIEIVLATAISPILLALSPFFLLHYLGRIFLKG